MGAIISSATPTRGGIHHSASLKRCAGETDSCLFTRPRSIRPVAGFAHGLLPHIILGDWRDLDFHATVLRFAFSGRLAGDGLPLAQATGGHPRRITPLTAAVHAQPL